MCDVIFSSNVFTRAVGWNKLKSFFLSAERSLEMTQRASTKLIYKLQLILANAIKARRNPRNRRGCWRMIEAMVIRRQSLPEVARGPSVSGCVLSR